MYDLTMANRCDTMRRDLSRRWTACTSQASLKMRCVCLCQSSVSRVILMFKKVVIVVKRSTSHEVRHTACLCVNEDGRPASVAINLCVCCPQQAGR